MEAEGKEKNLISARDIGTDTVPVSTGARKLTRPLDFYRVTREQCLLVAFKHIPV